MQKWAHSAWWSCSMGHLYIFPSINNHWFAWPKQLEGPAPGESWVSLWWFLPQWGGFSSATSWVISSVEQQVNKLVKWSAMSPGLRSFKFMPIYVLWDLISGRIQKAKSPCASPVRRQSGGIGLKAGAVFGRAVRAEAANSWIFRSPPGGSRGVTEKTRNLRLRHLGGKVPGWRHRIEGWGCFWTRSL